MVSFGGSFRSSQFGKNSLSGSKFRGSGSRIGNGSNRFGESVNGGSGDGEKQSGGGNSRAKYIQDTPWNKQDGASGLFGRGWSALVGNNKQKNIEQSEVVKLKEMKIKFMDGKGKTKKDLMVKYNSRKSRQRMEVYLHEGENKKMARAAFRRTVANEISNEIKKLSRSSSRFKKQQGLSRIGVSQARSAAKAIYKSGELKRGLSRSASGGFGHQKDSRRSQKIKIGK